ncbi:hypothetical protein EN784_01235 [bacterium M00.F.Ca.ET.141.01.1.1]|nr:hypothetical protein EN784_01235 [bacterium M00.F.Ca.ET.141.01.1.1]
MSSESRKIAFDRILVAIGVSKPEYLAELPGVIKAAERMAAWGGENGYQGILIHDAATKEHGPLPVTIERLRDEIGRAITEVTSERELKRLIVFFAGHGSAVDRGDNYWLLSNWRTNTSEAIKVRSFQRMLEFYGPRQVSIIADACQENDEEFIDVIGSAVLVRPTSDEEAQDYELDRFLAADTGKQSFMVKAQGDQEAYCLFSEIMLDALEGDAETAFVRYKTERCVTSESLYHYLRKTVPIEAGKLNLVMKPRPQPGFVTDKIYLKRSSLIAFGAPAGGSSGELRRIRAAPRVSLEKVADASDKLRAEAEESTRNDRRKSMVGEAQAASLPIRFESGCGLALWGIPAIGVSASTARIEASPDEPDHWYRLWLPNSKVGLSWTDVLVDVSDGRSAYVCGVAGFITALQLYSETETGLLHYRQGDRVPGAEALDLLAKANAGLLNYVELLNAAAEIRKQKHEILTIGCIVAQFYDAIRDVENIRRVASYYRAHEQIVPLDVALLSGGRFYAEGESLFVDVAATKKRVPRSAVERNLPYTYAGTPGCKRALVGGRAPWMRNGWSAVETANYDKSAHEWRDAALKVVPHLAPGPFSVVKPEGREALAALVGVTDRPFVPRFARSGS